MPLKDLWTRAWLDLGPLAAAPPSRLIWRAPDKLTARCLWKLKQIGHPAKSSTSTNQPVRT